MEVETERQASTTNCLECERYKQLGEVCVIEHGKKFLWEYCKDFQPEVRLPDYKELMETVKHDMALERKKLKEKKRKEVLARRKERENRNKEKLRLKRSKIAKKVWEMRKKRDAQSELRRPKKSRESEKKVREDKAQPSRKS